MRKAIAISMGLVFSTAASASCLYTLSPSISGLDPVLHGNTSFPVVSGQTVEFSVVQTIKYVDGHAVSDSKNYAATTSAAKSAISSALASSVPGGDIPLPSSGVVAAEYHVNNFVTSKPAAAGGDVLLTFGFTVGNGAPNGIGTDAFEHGVWIWANASTSRYMLASIAGTAAATVPPHPYKVAPTSKSLSALGAAKIGMYINVDTRRFGYTLDGVDMGYVTDMGGNPMYIPASVTHVALMVGGRVSGIYGTDPIIGQPAGGTLVTDAALMTQPFPSGAVDICGTPL